MSFRIVLIESDASIYLKYNNLVINKGEDEIWIPLEDISIMVLDNLRIQLTARLMSFLAEKNIGVVFCNKEHLPIGYFSSYDNHSRISKNIGYQIEKSKEFYDELWQKIVKQKIINQKQTLEMLKLPTESSKKLETLAEEVQCGDPSNREAHAAKVYFNTLMGTSFSRGNDDILLNSGLDYGYAIVRAYIARLCVAYGLNTQLGIHHKNEYNRFNLVDDLLEPVRPMVDMAAHRILLGEEYFKKEHRHKLVDFLNHKIMYMEKKMYIANMLEDYVSMYAALLAGKRDSLIFPEVINYYGDGEDV